MLSLWYYYLGDVDVHSILAMYLFLGLETLYARDPALEGTIPRLDYFNLTFVSGILQYSKTLI